MYPLHMPINKAILQLIVNSRGLNVFFPKCFECFMYLVVVNIFTFLLKQTRIFFFFKKKKNLKMHLQTSPIN